MLNLIFRFIIPYSREFKNQEGYQFSWKNKLKMKFKIFFNRILLNWWLLQLNPSPEWVSILVCVRLCVDMHDKTAIIENYHPIPTLNEILFKVNGAKI